MLVVVAGIDPKVLDGAHHPCPNCGGRDRFRLLDEDAGAVFCNQCFASNNGDGFAAISWMKGLKFPESVRAVAEYLGIEAGEAPTGEKANRPDSQLEWKEWNDVLVQMWARHKPPITIEAVQAVGGRLAKYLGQYIVVAFPVWGQLLDTSEPVGWLVLNSTGRTLPRKLPDGQVEWISKPKLTYGSTPGVIGNLDRLRTAKVVWKLEGLSDVLAWYSMPDTPPDHAAVTNAMGCQERPSKWMLGLLGDDGHRAVNVIHDCDVPGQRGAIGWDDDRGRHRTGWAEELAAAASESRNIVLPYPISEDHGKDFRDWVQEGGTFADLRKRADQAEIVHEVGSHINELPDDPNRLARINLERYAAATGGRTIRYWREEWYVWRKTAYRKIPEKELRSKIWQSVKAEFDRLWRQEHEAYREKIEAGTLEDDVKPPVCRKVCHQLVSNVIGATAGLTTVSSGIEMSTWLPTRERRSYLSTESGIIDFDAVLEDKELEECILPHSPNWFSEVCLPYHFNQQADCPQWKAFLEYNLEGNQQQINLAQEWAGYLLTPDTGEQAFMLLEGDGANGKSVYCAGLEAMLGSENCSFVQLELFSDRFSKTQTIGKLVNICGDVGEVDKVAEGTIKAFASGNSLYFDRKGVGGISCTPTARLMLACNNRPGLGDRSDGIWRRMKLIQWHLTVPPDRRIKNMDKPWWWIKSGEVPGILNWALIGIHRLRTQGGFTEVDSAREAIEEYRCERNSARSFLSEYTFEDQNGCIATDYLYRAYNHWARNNGYRPISSHHLGHEVKRLYPLVNKSRIRTQGKSSHWYTGVAAVDGIKDVFRDPKDLSSGGDPDTFD